MTCWSSSTVRSSLRAAAAAFAGNARRLEAAYLGS